MPKTKLTGNKTDVPSAGRTSKRAGRQHFAIGLPTVNLLSPAVFEALAVRRLRRRFAVAAVALVVLVGSGWAFQRSRVASVEEELATQQAHAARLAARVNALAPVRQFHADVERQKKSLTQAMASEVLFSRIVAEMRAQTPPDVQVQTWSVTMTNTGTGAASSSGSSTSASGSSAASTASACPQPDPFTPPSAVGCITIAGSASTRSAVGALIVRLAGSDLFVDPFITTTDASDEGKVTFNGTVGVTRKAFSMRYTDLKWITKAGGAR